MKLKRATWSPIGLDVGARQVHAVQVCTRGGESWIARAASLPRAQGDMGSEAGTELGAEEAGRIMQALGRQEFVGNRVVACAPVGKVMTSVLELPPRASGAPLGDIAKQEVCRTHKADPRQVEVEWWELPGGARASEGTHVMAVAVKHSDAEATMDALEAAGAEVLALDLPALALVRGCAGRLAAGTDLTAIVDLGWGATEIVIVRDGLVVYERSIREMGLEEVGKMLGSKLSVEPALIPFALDRVGCGAGAGGSMGENAVDWPLAGETGAMVSAHFDAVGVEIRMSLGYAGRRFGSMPTRVLLTGPGCGVPGGAARLRLGMETPVEEMSAEKVMKVDEAFAGVCRGPGVQRALGLALHESGRARS